ncbi:MAG: YgfZ/GcvT domain-containing protein [Steroidobacteraceae bacterium]
MKQPEMEVPPARSAAVELGALGVLAIRGTDAARFLQGQVSNDLERLVDGGSLLAGYHNPQGRTIAILRLVQAADGILALTPRELVPPVAARLARFVLRAKVQLRDESASWRVRGIVAPQPSGELHAKLADAPARWLVLDRREGEEPAHAPSAPRPAGNAPLGPAAALAPSAGRQWTLLDIAAGLPQVYSSTSEAFVAQMLNLDLLDGIALSKGCYTGQEVIARAHYRGRVKRRMQRWRTRGPCSLAPGEGGLLEDGRAFRVVEAAQLPDGRCEFLAVAPLDAAGPPEREAPLAAGTPAADDARAANGTPAPLAVEALPLPYPLPR